MKSKKILNSDGSTKKIVIANDSGSYSAYTPRQAAILINELKAQLWAGVPMDSNFVEMRNT